MIKNAMFLRQAQSTDIMALEQLLNRCYRQAEGWTNEAHLIGGIRTTQARLAHIIDDPTHFLFVYPHTLTGQCGGEETGELLGCIAVDIKEAGSEPPDGAYIGMFAVHPKCQGEGIGHRILQAAETFAVQHLSSNCQDHKSRPVRLAMSIVSHRPELLAYYERRGYKLTGHKEPFPHDGNNGEPKRSDLQLLALEKWLGETR